MAVLVVADHDNASLKDNTHKTVTAAKALSNDVDVLIAGKGVDAVAAEAAKIEGVRKVLVAESDPLGKQMAEAGAPIIGFRPTGAESLRSESVDSPGVMGQRFFGPRCSRCCGRRDASAGRRRHL